MSTITVSVGRNVGNVPMSDQAWQDFRAEVRRALSMGTIHVDDARSIGEWLGVSEESSTFVADDFTPGAAEMVTDALAIIGGRYGQDAVAVTVGETRLVTSQIIYDYETTE